jgi:hypothetical protein
MLTALVNQSVMATTRIRSAFYGMTTDWRWPIKRLHTILFKTNSEELDSPYHLLGRQQIVDQNHTAKHLPHGHGLLMAVGDAGVGHALCVKPEEVIVLSYADTSGGGGELEVRHISRADQTCFRSRSDVDVAPPKAGSDASRDVFV